MLFSLADQNLRILQWLKLMMISISWQLKLKMPWQACEIIVNGGSFPSLTVWPNEAINQTQPIHPVTFHGYNLSDLVVTGRLCKLTVPVLRDI